MKRHSCLWTVALALLAVNAFALDKTPAVNLPSVLRGSKFATNYADDPEPSPSDQLVPIPASPTDPPACCSPMDCNCCCESCWYLQAEALFLQRDNHSVDRAVVLSDATGATLLSTRDLNFDGAAGPRVIVGRQLDDCSAWEGVYFGMFGASAARTARDTNNLDIPPVLVVPATDFDNADAMRLTYESRLHNVEINYVDARSGSLWNGASLLAGFRYVNLDERFNINSLDNDGTRSDYRINTHNNLFGAQIGARVARRREAAVGWDVTGKAGIFGNDAQQRQFVGDNDNLTVLRSTSSRDGAVAFVGDVNASLVYPLNRVWSLRGGYNVMWIEGVALAADQLDFSFNAASGTGVRDRGGVFLHGANAGLEARW